MFTNIERIVLRIGLLGAAASLLFLIGCQPAANTNVNANVNANASPANANANTNSSSTTSGLDTAEPEKYSATLVFTLQTSGGDKAMGIPPLSVQVARNAADRRVEFKLPDGTPLVYLDHDNRHYVIVPSKKQYAELSKESTGAQLQKLMTPGQIVADLKNKSGVEKVGEEQVNGRLAEKYRYATSKDTKTQAGEVTAEAFVFIDKEAPGSSKDFEIKVCELAELWVIAIPFSFTRSEIDQQIEMPHVALTKQLVLQHCAERGR